MGTIIAPGSRVTNLPLNGIYVGGRRLGTVLELSRGFTTGRRMAKVHWDGQTVTGFKTPLEYLKRVNPVEEWAIRNDVDLDTRIDSLPTELKVDFRKRFGGYMAPAWKRNDA